MNNSQPTSDEREEQLKLIRERAATYLTGSVHAELYHQDVTLLLSLLDSRYDEGAQWGIDHAQSEYLRGRSDAVTPSTATAAEHLKQTIERGIHEHNLSRTHAPKYCCPEDEAVYDRLLTRRLVEELSSATPSAVPVEEQNRPKIICLCGSTRFIEQFAIQTWELERQGFIVLGCTLLPMWYCNTPDHFGEATGTKEQCDELHLRKIDLADQVVVLNIGGYIGESTAREIAYATALGKPIHYLEPTNATTDNDSDCQPGASK